MIGALSSLHTENSNLFHTQVIVTLLERRETEVRAPKGWLSNLSDPRILSPGQLDLDMNTLDAKLETLFEAYES